MERYFLVAYNHEQGFGQIAIKTQDCFPSCVYIQAEVKKALKNYSVIVVLSVFEFNTKQDFLDFNY